MLTEVCGVTMSDNKKRRIKKQSSPKSHPGETFWYMAHKYLYDVDLACRIVDDGREVMELDEESTEFAVRTSELNKEHVKRVNPENPGIVAHIRYQTDEGEMVHGHLLIDGHHRAARCMELGIPFNIQLLTEEESEQVLLRSPLKAELQTA